MSVYSGLVSTALGVAAGTWAGVASRLADGSDATGVVKTSYAAGDFIVYRCSAPAIPAGEVVTRVRAKVRTTRPSSKSGVSVACGTYAAGVLRVTSQAASADGAAASAGWAVQAWQDRQAWLGKVTGSGGGKGKGILPGDTPSPVGNPWTAADLANLIIRVGDRALTASAISTLLEAGVDVETASVPLAPTVALPTGTVTDTTQPTVGWTHNDKTVKTVTTKALTSNVATITTSAAHGFAVGQTVSVAIGDATFDGAWTITAVTSTTFSYSVSAANIGSTAATGSAWVGDDAPQVAATVRVFSAAEYGVAGFDPATSPGTWTGYVTGNSGSLVVGVPLQTGTTYRAYVVTTKRSPSSAQGTITGTSWGYSQFTLSLAAPPAPTVTTAWDAALQANRVIVQGYANMLTAGQSSGEDGTVNSWAALLNCGVANSGAWGAVGTKSFQMTATAAGDMRAWLGSPIPIVAGQSYTVNLTTRAATTGRQTKAAAFWLNASGAYMSENEGSLTTNSTASDTAHSVSAVAPPGAAFVRPGLTVLAAAAGEVHRFDRIGLMPGTGTPWSAGGLTASTLTLTRVLPGTGNLLTADEATMDAGVGQWQAHTNATVGRALDPLGRWAFAWRSAAAGDSRVKCGLDPVVPGAAYAVCVDVIRYSATSRNVRLDVSFWTAAGGYISGLSSATAAPTTGAYSTFTVTGLVPAAAAYATVEAVALSTAAAGEAWALRRACLRPGTDPTFVAGDSWAADAASQGVRGYQAVSLDLAGQRADLYDYEAPRSSAAVVAYAATVVHTIASAKVSLTGYGSAAATPGDGRWWVIPVEAPTLARACVVERGTSLAVDETAGVFHPLGRGGEAVVVSGDVSGRDGTYTIRAYDTTEGEAVEAIALHQGVLLLREPWVNAAGVGVQRWVKVVKRTRQPRTGGTVSWALGVVEVGSGVV